MTSVLQDLLDLPGPHRVYLASSPAAAGALSALPGSRRERHISRTAISVSPLATYSPGCVVQLRAQVGEVEVSTELEVRQATQEEAMAWLQSRPRDVVLVIEDEARGD